MIKFTVLYDNATVILGFISNESTILNFYFSEIWKYDSTIRSSIVRKSAVDEFYSLKLEILRIKRVDNRAIVNTIDAT